VLAERSIISAVPPAVPHRPKGTGPAAAPSCRRQHVALKSGVDTSLRLMHARRMGRGRFGTFLAVFVGAPAALLVASCGDARDDSASGRKWVCFEQGLDDCSCQVLSAGESAAGPAEAEACSAADCCLLVQTSASDRDATCECLASNDCQAEADSRRDAQVVEQCPPAGEVVKSPVACAAEGENCRQQYLQQNQLEGCCEGTVCKPGSGDVPVCQAATAEEQSAARECSRLASSSELQRLELETATLATSVGELALPEPQYAFIGVGPGGCLNSLELDLRRGDDIDCYLRIAASLDAGELVIDRLSGSIDGCEGFTGDPEEPLAGTLFADSSIESFGKLSFEGLACDGALIIESYCVAGRFDVHLDQNTLGEVGLNEQHLILHGAVCFAEPEGDCPAR